MDLGLATKQVNFKVKFEMFLQGGHLDAHAGVEQQGEVPDLVRELVAEHGDGGGEARGEAHGEGRAHRDPVREVVHGVADDDHEAGGRHGAAAGAAQRLVTAVPLVQTVEAAHTLRLETW